MDSKLILVLVCVAVGVIQQAESHGYMKDPAGRASAWRFGFKTPRNSEDDECNCGGFGNQWDKHNGACGLCGDPVQGPLRHQAGGRFATGTITKTYRAGSTIDITVFITTQHGGWYEFSICPVNNKNKKITQSCLQKMQLADGSYQWKVPRPWPMGNNKISVKLPPGLTCSQCVIQWKWHCGNNWGCDKSGCGMGHGQQEEFYGCADVAIN